MKKTFLLSLATFCSLAALGQNTAVVTQQGSTHAVSVVQQGTDNTSVISQSGAGTPSNVNITQSGSGNGVTIHQKSTMDDPSDSTHSVTAWQIGTGETTIHQTNAGNTLHIHQSGPMPVTTEEKSRRKQPRK